MRHHEWCVHPRPKAEVRSMSSRRVPGVSRRAAMQTTGLASIAAGLALGSTGAPAAAQSSAASGIVGTWHLRMAVPRATTDRVELEMLGVFIPGGVLLVLDCPVEQREPADYPGPWGGQWLQLPDGSVRATAIQLVYDRRAVVTAEETAVYTLAYDGATDTLTGTGEWREVGRDGTVRRTGTASVTGTRVGVQG